MLADATQSLIAVARNSASSEADLNAVTEAFFKAASRASKDEVNSALRTLSNHFVIDDLSRGAYLAVLCGACVERGCDPLSIADPLTKQLESLLKSSVELAQTCFDRMPKSDNDDHDPHEEFDKLRTELAATMPSQHAAWLALESFWRPAIAVYSVSAQARSAARPLRDLAAKISDHHEAGHWLRLMLTVLDNEPIVVIEPATSTGIVGRISGIVDNFQLNTLIMDVFPKAGFFSRRRVSRSVADIAKGKGPQQSNDVVRGVWNLYTWRAIRPNLQLPDSSDHAASEFWVWNEGSPEDISVFDGHRVVLLGPPTYQRTWQSQRMFNHLPAELHCERTLTKGEVTNWLQKMHATNS